ncbi:MAG: potassium transporter Kef [Marinilabiliales bacterium]|nr:MAG: potassium transporter Kef [Marinilabiliales bacterium]
MFELWSIDAIWISVAFLFGILAKRIKLPPLLGYLAGGFALNYFGITEGGVALHMVADLGIMLLLFTIGLKLDIKALISKDVWLSTGIHMVLSILAFSSLVFFISFLGLKNLSEISLTGSILIGFALSFSSTVFAVKVLEDRGEMTSFHGNLSIAILIVQDIIAVIFLTISKGELPNIWALGLPVYLFVIRYVLIWFLKFLDQSELLTLFGFLAAFVAGAFVFEFVGIKPDLGALIIGMLIGTDSRSKELSKHMLGFKDFFLIAFFLNIGMSGLPNLNILLISLVLVLFIPFKATFFMLILTRLNLRARTAWHTSLSLSNFSEFGLIVGVIGVKLGLISDQWLIVLALAMSFSFLLISPFNIRTHTLFEKYAPWLMKLNTDKKHPDDQPLDLGNAQVIICGMGHVGRAAYHQLTIDYPNRVIGIDYNRNVVNNLRSANKNVLWGDSTDFNFWRNANMPDVELVMVTMNDHASNYNTAHALENCSNESIKIAAPGYTSNEHNSLKSAGVDYVYNYYGRAGTEFAASFLKFIHERDRSQMDKTQAPESFSD